MRLSVQRRGRQPRLRGLRPERARPADALQARRGVSVVLVGKVQAGDVHYPRVLLAVHPARSHPQPAAGQGRVRAAGHLRDARIQHHGLPLPGRALQRKPGTLLDLVATAETAAAEDAGGATQDSGEAPAEAAAGDPARADGRRAGRAQPVQPAAADGEVAAEAVAVVFEEQTEADVVVETPDAEAQAGEEEAGFDRRAGASQT